jgi:triacylglycerol lipase
MAFSRTDSVNLGHFVDAAYRMHDEPDPNPDLPTPKGIPTGFTFIAWIQMYDFFMGRRFVQFYGFIVKDDADPQHHIVALRGTVGNAEWWDDAHAAFEAFDESPDSGLVHLGFHEIYKTLKVVVKSPVGLMHETYNARVLSGGFAAQVEAAARVHMPAVRAEMAEPIRYTVTAHSLGAALATYFTLDTMKNHSPSFVDKLCTFASPRTGDRKFANSLNTCGTELWRIVNEPDLVTQVPYRWMGFEHTAGLESYNSAKTVKNTVKCWHALSTYLVLLGDAESSLGECAPNASDMQMSDRYAEAINEEAYTAFLRLDSK